MQTRHTQHAHAQNTHTDTRNRVYNTPALCVCVAYHHDGAFILPVCKHAAFLGWGGRNAFLVGDKFRIDALSISYNVEYTITTDLVNTKT